MAINNAAYVIPQDVHSCRSLFVATCSKDMIFKWILTELLICLFMYCSHYRPWMKKKRKRWQFFKHLLKSWIHVWACHETTEEFLPYSHFDEPLESLGKSQVKSGASCTFWCFVSNRAAFVQLSERERFTVGVCLVTTNTRHTCLFFLFNFNWGYIDTIRRVFHTVTMGIINQESMVFCVCM